MAAFVQHEQPDLDDPVLVVMLQGWIDAGAAAASAMTLLDAAVGARPIVTFDADTFIDFRARRPVMELRDGVNTGLVWPDISLRAGKDAAGQDVLLLLGFEPDAQWHLFCDTVVGLAVDLGVRMVVGLGAYPFASPHTRPSRLSITASTPELAASLPYLRSSVDVPAGVEAALERRFADAGVPAVGLWAQVPHYVANMAYPAASVTLLTGLHEVAGVVTDTSDLRDEAAAVRARLDELVAGNPEHVAMLRQMEAAHDEEAAAEPPIQPGDLPSGDELAAELERFLREQGKGG
jgi:hypothetical protein